MATRRVVRPRRPKRKARRPRGRVAPRAPCGGRGGGPRSPESWGTPGSSRRWFPVAQAAPVSASVCMRSSPGWVSACVRACARGRRRVRGSARGWVGVCVCTRVRPGLCPAGAGGRVPPPPQPPAAPPRPPPPAPAASSPPPRSPPPPRTFSCSPSLPLGSQRRTPRSSRWPPRESPAATAQPVPAEPPSAWAPVGGTDTGAEGWAAGGVRVRERVCGSLCADGWGV